MICTFYFFNYHKVQKIDELSEVKVYIAGTRIVKNEIRKVFRSENQDIIKRIKYRVTAVIKLMEYISYYNIKEYYIYKIK